MRTKKRPLNEVQKLVPTVLYFISLVITITIILN